jgi:3-isopropylmalate dehydrogenase
MTQNENYNLLLLAGDGIGPEAMTEVKKIIAWLNDNTAATYSFEEDFIGGCAYDAYGTPLADTTITKAKQSDAIILGAVGGPKWDGKTDYALRPEAGLLKIRKELELFANLRPAIVFDALVDASSLKPELIKGLDILIVRELTGGVYFGEPRGIDTLPNGERKGYNTQVYTTSEIRRIAEVAFDMAKKRSNFVTSCEKANVMESGVLWREEVTKLHQESHRDVRLEHMYADNCAMQLCRAPKQFDVIVTDNLFGDILSDEAAMLTGSLGMLPSASLGAIDAASGKRHALYEPVHGSAPDIAGQNKANPLATILSFAMALRYSLNQTAYADLLEQSVQSVLNAGIRTTDIAESSHSPIGTSEMGDAIIKQLNIGLENSKVV